MDVFATASEPTEGLPVVYERVDEISNLSWKKIEPMTKNDPYNQIIPCDETDSFSEVARKLAEVLPLVPVTMMRSAIALPRTLAGSEPNNL
jgi:hypothetical protein